MKINSYPGAVLALACVCVLLMMAGPAKSDDSEAWQALREGRAVLMLRHALAPGTGDPAGPCIQQPVVSVYGDGYGNEYGDSD